MSWSTEVEVAVQTAVLNALAADGASAYLDIYDADDVLLSTLPFTHPPGTVSEEGVLSLTFGARDDEAAAGGTASYVQLKTSAGTVVNDSIPCIESLTPVSGYFAMPSLLIVEGAPVEGVDPFDIG